MTKTRVPKGEHYYWIMSSEGKFISIYDVDTNAFVDRERMKNRNYFNTEKEADAVARKLNAVLKGADVIKMPESNEVDMIQREIGLEVGGEDEELVEAASLGAINMINWLIDKIVK